MPFPCKINKLMICTTRFIWKIPQLSCSAQREEKKICLINQQLLLFDTCKLFLLSSLLLLGASLAPALLVFDNVHAMIEYIIDL